MYNIFYTKKAANDLNNLDITSQKKIKLKLEIVSKNPGISNNIKQLRGVKNGYRLRVDRYRVLYLLINQEKQIIVARVFMKKNDSDYNKFLRDLNY